MSPINSLTKGQKRELRRIIGLAYERELSAKLSELEEQFRRWRAGEIDAHDVSQAIHEFHQGAAREIWSRYNGGDLLLTAMIAVHGGTVAEHEVASGMLELIRRRP